MTDRLRVGATRRIAFLIVAMLPVAALTTSGVPWNWGFALTYLAAAFVLQTLVRLKCAGLERFIHILVLSGSAPVVVRSYFGMDLNARGVVHIVAVLVISISAGYLLADRIRPQVQRSS